MRQISIFFSHSYHQTGPQKSGGISQRTKAASGRREGVNTIRGESRKLSGINEKERSSTTDNMEAEKTDMSRFKIPPTAAVVTT